MQVSYFSDGGFVIHQIPSLSGKTKISMWVSPQGGITDHEVVSLRSGMIVRCFSEKSAEWKELETLAARYHSEQVRMHFFKYGNPNAMRHKVGQYRVPGNKGSA